LRRPHFFSEGEVTVIICKRLLPVLALVALLAGCIPTQRQLTMERDLEEMKRRLAASERALASKLNQRGDETSNRLEALSRRQAELQASLDALRLELQALNGRLADLSQADNELRDELSLVRDDLGLKISAIEDKLARPSAKSRAQTAPSAESPEDLYRRAVAMIRSEERYGEGRELLQRFLQQQPQHSLSANASYWIGEAYFGEKKYENAILQFQDVIDKHSDHPKAAAAQLKQGITFQTLGDNQSAKAIFSKLVDSFPLSTEAKEAKRRLASMS
jgi:tol-pal system protein YbgF